MEFPSFDLDPDEVEEPVEFFAEDVDIELAKPDQYRRWVEQVIQDEGCQLLRVQYIFCSDNFLQDLHFRYLQDDTLTDIMTFPYRDHPEIESDIFISIDRVRENASSLGIPFEEELRRVMIHGVLHLCGYPDKTAEESRKMREKENEKLAFWQNGHE